MKFSYEDLKFYEFIEELNRQKAVIEKRNDQQIKNEIIVDIKKEHLRISSLIKGLDVYEQDCFIAEFQEFVAEKIIEYYNEMSAKFQKTYAIFENQIAKVGTGKLFDFNAYPKINSMNNAVNVLKHGKCGRSYNFLVNTNSKYLSLPKEFLSIVPDMPQQLMLGIIESKYSGALLNLEFNDLVEFLDEAILAWEDRIKTNKEWGITDTHTI